ncbi:hypothetical protein OU994_14580 [Pseudoduganella sp. SL102]|uniref:DUF6572 domain-containing protein n=1 Tax=Pseudoduganella sp. SL102 TaxID=2995154 RepID=UPI00248B5468|nr:DUF6572 domain-containing protein [Pseudoduganella sp. SL102]WBS05412.1 hypothetical protein OU994_14580 [Pseudoduganella sp. SL102]
MGLENISVVDAVGTETTSDCVVLSIVDSWDWSDEHGHLLALQSKLNAYFGFVESGQIHEAYPAAEGKSLRIDLISRYPLPTTAVDFLKNAKAVAEELAISLRWNTLPGGSAV